MGTARAVIRSGVGGLLFGGVLYLAGDTASDLVVYSKLHSQAMQLVKADPDIGKVCRRGEDGGRVVVGK